MVLRYISFRSVTSYGISSQPAAPLRQGSVHSLISREEPMTRFYDELTNMLDLFPPQSLSKASERKVFLPAMIIK